MKAVFIDAHGGLDVMRYGELADPVCGETGVIVDVHAASVNAADSQSRRGEYFRAPKFPHILGRDFSGLVSEIGSRVTALRPGDAVFGVCDLGLEGAYAEKIALESALVTRKPETVTHVEAAAAALAWLTAIVSIEHTLKLKPGERILIQGGAGGVGSFAVQLSKHIGAHVIATARAVNHDYLRALGADEVIDYEEMDFRLATAACDAVFDTIGGAVALASFDVLKPGGRAAFIASGIDAPPSPRRGVDSLRPLVGRSRTHLERIVALFEAGSVQVPAIETFPLAAAAAAHAVSETRHLRGKLVLQVRDPAG